MAPAGAEMLGALGGVVRTVGIGDFVQAPEALLALPRVGAYDAPNVERILELRADLFITVASQAGATAHGRLSTLGIEVMALDTQTHDGVFRALADLGARIGAADRAAELAATMRMELTAVRQRAAALPRRKVLFVVDRDPLFVAGPGSHIDRMIEAAGGVNVAADAPNAYHRLSIEAALERLPEVIIDTSSNGASAPRGRLKGDWARWSILPAVRDDRVWQVDPSRLVIPGIRLPEMTRLMARLIHPEEFGEPAAAELAR
ncbi:MAG: helical backbone metal receptor [Planctomycetota bacterium]